MNKDNIVQKYVNFMKINQIKASKYSITIGKFYLIMSLRVKKICA